MFKHVPELRPRCKNESMQKEHSIKPKALMAATSHSQLGTEYET